MSAADGGDLMSLLFGGYQPGSWFYIRDADTGWSRKEGPRPYLLLETASRPVLQTRPRSSTVESPIPHGPHPVEHGCRINLSGWIAEPYPVATELCTADSYMCFEPDDEILARCGIP